MNAKIESVRYQLLRRLPRRLVLHKISRGFHILRIVGEGPTHLIFLPEELVYTMKRARLEMLLADSGIAALLRTAREGKRFCVSPTGVSEITDNTPGDPGNRTAA